MSWLSSLFKSAPPPAPPPNIVEIPEELVGRLNRDGQPLSESVVAILRSHFEAEDHPAPASEQIPFWLEREKVGTGDLEDQLRDKVTQRRAAEEQS